MIKLCDEIKNHLKPAQVNHLYELLICHRRKTPAFLSQNGKTILETKGKSLIWVNGSKKTPMAIMASYRNSDFDQYHSAFDWESPFITPIASLMFVKGSKVTGCVAHDEEGNPINHFPLSGVQQLFEADPTRFQ